MLNDDSVALFVATSCAAVREWPLPVRRDCEFLGGYRARNLRASQQSRWPSLRLVESPSLGSLEDPSSIFSTASSVLGSRPASFAETARPPASSTLMSSSRCTP